MKPSVKNLSDLETSLICAVTHDIRVCDDCQKCGKNGAEIRVKLFKEIKKLFAELRRK